MKPASRIAYVDTAKGLGILLVVLGHARFVHTPQGEVFEAIYSFHMPLFVFLSGMVFKPTDRLMDTVKKRAASLLRPYFFTVMISGISGFFLYENFSLLNFSLAALYTNGFYLAWIPLWYLPFLFLIQVSAQVCCSARSVVTKSLSYHACLAIGAYCLGLWLLPQFWQLRLPLPFDKFQVFYMYGLPWSLDVVPLGLFFFVLGYCARSMPVRFFSNWALGVIAIIAFIGLHLGFDVALDMNSRRIDHGLIVLIEALLGIYVSLFVSWFIVANASLLNKLLSLFSRHVVVIFCFHFPVMLSTTNMLMPQFPESYGLVSAVSVVLGLFLPLILSYVLIERLPWLAYWYFPKSNFAARPKI